MRSPTAVKMPIETSAALSASNGADSEVRRHSRHVPMRTSKSTIGDYDLMPLSTPAFAVELAARCARLRVQGHWVSRNTTPPSSWPRYGGDARVRLTVPAGCARPRSTCDLLLAVDASGSVDATRFELQRRGYVAAFRNPQVLEAIRGGGKQSIAVAMFQWTGPQLQAEIVPWTMIKDAASAQTVACPDRDHAAPAFGGGTSISGAIDYAMRWFPRSPFQGERRVIDVSGDGSNNRGRSVTRARDEAVAADVASTACRSSPGARSRLLLQEQRDRRSGRVHDRRQGLRYLRGRHPQEDDQRDRFQPALAPPTRPLATPERATPGSAVCAPWNLAGSAMLSVRLMIEHGEIQWRRSSPGAG